MNPQRKFTLRVSCLAGLLAALPAPAQTAGSDCRDATITLGASTRDRVVHQQDDRSLLIEVSRLTGIGRLKLQPSAPGCPASVVIRLHDFQELESFRARTPDAALSCEQMRMEGKRPQFVCYLGQKEIDAARRKPAYVEVELPSSLLESGSPVEIHWVDQWR